LTGSGKTNLAWRVATAVVVLPPLLYAVLLGPPSTAVAVVGAAALAGILEFFQLLEAGGVHPQRLTGLLLTAAFFVDAGFPDHPYVPLWPLASVALLGSTLSGWDADAPGRLPGAAMTLLGAAYLGGLSGTIGALRRLPPAGEGPFRLVLLLGAVMAGDTFAYFVGKALGRRRLAPVLSPGKTLEGALGGLVGGALGALVVRDLMEPSLPLLHALALGVLLSALGAIGDLFESLLKRWAGVKDSGRLFPGHGGMLDRLDSLLFGAPLLYYYFGVLR
jgi:phosphatidate cytidylyltransferase